MALNIQSEEFSHWQHPVACSWSHTATLISAGWRCDLQYQFAKLPFPRNKREHFRGSVGAGQALGVPYKVPPLPINAYPCPAESTWMYLAGGTRKSKARMRLGSWRDMRGEQGHPCSLKEGRLVWELLVPKTGQI